MFTSYITTKTPNYFKMWLLKEPLNCYKSNIFGGCTAQFWSTLQTFHAVLHCVKQKVKIILLTMGILFPKVNSDTPDSFHDNRRWVHKIFQKTHVPYYIILDTWTIILKFAPLCILHFQLYFMWKLYNYWRKQRVVKSTNSKICRKCDLP